MRNFRLTGLSNWIKNVRKIINMEKFSYAERLRMLGLCSMEKKRLWGDLTVTSEGACKQDGERHFYQGL